MHGLLLVVSLGIKRPLVYGDSLLVVRQVNKEWDINKETMDAYVEEIRKLENKFSGLEIHHVSGDEWHLVVSYSWGYFFLGAQELPSLVRRLNLVTTYSGRRRTFFSRCDKRTCEAIIVIPLQTIINT